MTKQTALEPLVASLQKKPIALAVRDKLLNCQTAPALASAMMMATPAAFGQQATEATGGGALEEVLVTAQKRVESLQEVPLSIQVLDTGRLQELNIDSFDSYIQYMPNVSYWSKKPGEASIYIRGISDGGDGNASGSAPSVAVYVDEQPVTSIGRNLDVHIYDIARIEVLAGPQGTLYGANSQAGNLRIITNKPNPDGFEAGLRQRHHCGQFRDRERRHQRGHQHRSTRRAALRPE
jgi:outer membrane receptor protein involved in Fe transport